MRVLLLIAAAIVLVTAFATRPVKAEGLDFSAGITGASERIFRGYSVTGGQPGVEAWAEADYKGFYVQVLGGNRSYDAAFSDFEVAGTAGFRHDLLGILFDAGATYTYFGGALNDCLPNPDYFEFHLAAATEIAGFNVAAAARYSPDFIFSTGDYWRYEGGLSHAIPLGFDFADFSIFANVGHNNSQFGDWQDFKAGVQADRGPFFLRASYSTTNDFPIGGWIGANADGRVLFEVGALIN